MFNFVQLKLQSCEKTNYDWEKIFAKETFD